MTVDTEMRLVNEPRRLWRGTRRDLLELWRHRELLRALTARELRARYKGSRLGWGWALVRPMVMLFVYGVAVGIFLGAGRSIPQFMIFIYTGMVAWNLFAAIVQGSITSLISNGALLTRANFPPLLLPLSTVIAALVDFVLQASVLTIGYVVFDDWPSVDALKSLPAALVALVTIGFGVGSVLAAVNVYVRDVNFLVDVGLQVLFWLTPVLYAYGQVVSGASAFGMGASWVTCIYMLNPMANVVIGFQQALWPAAASPRASAYAFPGDLGFRLAAFSIAGVFVTWIGVRVFVRLSANFGQEL